MKTDRTEYNKQWSLDIYERRKDEFALYLNKYNNKKE